MGDEIGATGMGMTGIGDTGIGDTRIAIGGCDDGEMGGADGDIGAGTVIRDLQFGHLPFFPAAPSEIEILNLHDGQLNRIGMGLSSGKEPGAARLADRPKKNRGCIVQPHVRHVASVNFLPVSIAAGLALRRVLALRAAVPLAGLAESFLALGAFKCS